MAKTFLRAEWRKLVLANYTIDPIILKPYLPFKTELDLWNNICYVSLVGFMFQNTRVKGFRIPYHVNFEEVNLRFYVRHRQNGIWKRGVVFIKEIVPKPALTLVANMVYREHYITRPMSHLWESQADKWHIHYSWGKGLTNVLQITTGKELTYILPNSEGEFITEHYWGYTKINEVKTAEYGVEHPQWAIYETMDFVINVDFEHNYGREFAFLKKEQPVSIFLVEGSEISVKKGITL